VGGLKYCGAVTLPQDKTRQEGERESKEECGGTWKRVNVRCNKEGRIQIMVYCLTFVVRIRFPCREGGGGVMGNRENE
jgi:hypothetical protein